MNTPCIDRQLATLTPQACPSEVQLRLWVQQALLPATPTACEVTLRFVDTPESQELNATYRSQNKPTNVLSFPCDAPIDFASAGELVLLGDLVLCVPLILEEAREQQKKTEHHWAHLVIHGLLHLQGLDHQEDSEAEQMEALERQQLAQLGIPDPYADPLCTQPRTNLKGDSTPP